MSLALRNSDRNRDKIVNMGHLRNAVTGACRGRPGEEKGGSRMQPGFQYGGMATGDALTEKENQ